MDWPHLLAFNLTLLAAMASPGPALLLALRTSLVQGPRAGIATGLGLGTMAAAWTAAALLGLEAIFALVPWAYLTLKVAGALYLLWLAAALWRDARTPLSESGRSAGGQAFRTGLLVNLANPKSVLFAASVLLVIFPAGLAPHEKALIVANHLAVEWTLCSLFALALATPPARSGYLALKPVLDRVAAAVLAALGLKLLIDR
ncbi:lysine transporter LysE [Roseivivax halodurans JCM 10272]|uniref:Lysine transporter LysE n=1 Tax=Roseivivax halodurans JCM 10272 TaxID=1449350 RepID=X7EN35_9RHOB|nr:LysE family translocator [Roseivivax halodurans]ETX16573.1 lysine transporter LysE [Roseivivax halodurans JCM 10272]